MRPNPGPNYNTDNSYRRPCEVPQHVNEVIAKILVQQPSRTLRGSHPDITVYEVSGWNIYVLTAPINGQETKLFIDTSQPSQASEIFLYQGGQLKGKANMRLNGQYDKSAIQYFRGSLTIDFTPPDKAQE